MIIKLSNKQAMEKIARELGRVKGIMSLPKVFSGLQESSLGYKIPKNSHIISVLNKCNNKIQKFITLQKIFSVHPGLSQTIITEIQPALKKLGFSYINGVIVENKSKSQKNLKNKAVKITKKYAKKSNLISEALINKGEKLSQAYFAVYLIENHLRIFIWKLAGKSNRKLKKLFNTNDKKKVNDRKTKEKQNKWLSLRKDSDLFYLDIDDLGKLIQRNYALFSKYFSDQNAIRAKIDEITLIRNRVAHSNSSITENEKKTLELYMDQIFMQIK